MKNVTSLLILRTLVLVSHIRLCSYKQVSVRYPHVLINITGGLSLAVEGPSKAEITCQDNDDGTCSVSYLPTEPGLYNIVVKFDDEHIMGSPFTSYIAGMLLLYAR